jgi:Fe-S-cluster-containing hydrogenase component 2
MGVLSKWMESLDYEYEILPSCTRRVSPRSNCRKCVNICDKKAITIKNGVPVLDRNNCIECGNCISACPVQAIAGIYPKRTIIQNQLVIRGKNKPTVKELLILYKKGIKKIVGETQALINSWKDSIDEANEVLERLDEEPFSVVTNSVKEETYVSRRELFFLWKNEGKSVIQDVAPAKWRFNYRDIDLSKYYENVQFTRITINIEKCSLCTICQKLCRKQCFHIEEGHFALSTQGCENCQLCVETCPEQAILVEDYISKAEETLLPIYEKVCQTCQRTFKTLDEHDETCVACKKYGRIHRIMESE